MALPEPIIKLEKVHLTLNSAAGPVHILRGIDLNLPTGKAIGILGPSGSGKSTLMAVMTGLERASSGTVIVDNVDYCAGSEDALALHRRHRIGILLQAFHLIPTMTALENVAVPLELAGDRKAFEKAEAELKAVGLSHRLDHYPAQLSGGEQQRVALARALAPGPALLFADEPTGNLDGETGSQIIDLIFALHDQRDTTLILITHDHALAARCDMMVHMDSGLVNEIVEAPGSKGKVKPLPQASSAT